MIPTLNQSKCLQTLNEWGRSHIEPAPVCPSSVSTRLPGCLDMEDLTILLLVAHKNGVSVMVVDHSVSGLALCLYVSESDPPSLTKLRRRAHAGRLSAKKGGE